MKKKIKDLTLGEMICICNTCRHCANCPLDNDKNSCLTLFGLENKKVPKNYLNKEIEVGYE